MVHMWMHQVSNWELWVPKPMFFLGHIVAFIFKVIYSISAQSFNLSFCHQHLGFAAEYGKNVYIKSLVHLY